MCIHDIIMCEGQRNIQLIFSHKFLFKRWWLYAYLHLILSAEMPQPQVLNVNITYITTLDPGHEEYYEW
jgi:hypothetical protein